MVLLRGFIVLSNKKIENYFIEIDKIKVIVSGVPMIGSQY